MSEQLASPVTERVPMPSLVGGPVVLPDVRRRPESGSTGTPNAQPRTGARTREAQRRARRGDTRPTHSDAASALPLRLAGRIVAQDAAILHLSQPHSLAQIWEMHAQSARYFEAAALRWPRYAYGALHLALAAAVYSLVWVTRSPPLAILTAAVIALAVWLS